MEHNHKGQFCLPCVLQKITPLLPHQGPIKDFIHQNTLQVFMDKPFHDAVRVGAELYGAKPYLDLGYYRAKYTNGEVADHCLIEAAEEHLGALKHGERDVVCNALFNFVEITDETTLKFLATKKKFDAHDVKAARDRVARFHESSEKVSLRKLLNDKLGCAIDHEVNAIFFRLLGSYLDQGVILWPLLEECQSFRSAVLSLAEDSSLPLASFVDNDDLAVYLEAGAEHGVLRALANMFSSETLYADYVQESLLHHPGWSGMVNVIAHNKDALAKRRNISMEEILLVKLSLEWQFIKHAQPDFTRISVEDRDRAAQAQRKLINAQELSMAYWLLQGGKDLATAPDHLLSRLNAVLLQQIWHVAIEKHYYATIAQKFAVEEGETNKAVPKKFQAIFCIDDRECSFRRHLEAQDPSIETFGFPGFFGIEFFFKSHQKDLLEKMCPVPVTPQYVVMERSVKPRPQSKDKKILEFASFVSRHGANSIFFGFISAYTLGHLSAFRLLFSFLQPSILKSSNRRTGLCEKTELIFERKDDGATTKGLHYGFTHEEMAQRVFTSLRNMGLDSNFAPIVMAIAHGSSSVNNPHFAAYDCGACSGRPGGINARLFAAMANLKEVRDGVKARGITIPDETVFVGGLHDTCTDEVKFFDIDKLSPLQLNMLKEFAGHVAVAQRKNAKERCKRFALVSPKISEKKALKEVQHRSRALFEPRPELGHATNALCIVGRRERSYGKNFDRRAFLQSYDPTKDDAGNVLAAIMGAVIPVCGGINLEYFFSRVDPAVYGCGNKLSHNVCSLIGVGNGLDDDLRTGLPIQMTEIHDPFRLLIIIEQTPAIIEKAVLTNPALAVWVTNDWLKIASLDPSSNDLSFYDHKKRAFAGFSPARRQAC